MKYLTGFASTVSWVNDQTGRLFVCYLPILMFFLLLLEIIARYVFSSPTIWATELTQMVFGVYVMLSGGYLLFHKGHISVDVVYGKFSPRTKAILDVVTSFLFFAFIAVILKEGWYMAEDSFSRLETSHSAWNPPIWPVKMAIPIGACLLLIQGMAKLIRDIEIVIDPSRPAEPAVDEEREYL